MTLKTLDFALNLNYEVLQRSSAGKSLNVVGETNIICFRAV